MGERILLPCSKPNILKLPECKETDADRFNDLPDALLLHILSFLDMKEVLPTSLISKRWRYLWVSLPTINIDRSFWKDKDELFRDFVENVVLHHDESNIQKFKLVLHYSHLIDTHQTIKWVSYAVSRQVQELHLGFLILVPTPSLFCQVKTLKLTSVSFSKFPKEYALDFPILEYLVFKDCHYGVENLTISAPHLKTFLVEYFHLRPCCAVNIQSPNLTSLQLNGYMYEDYALDQLSFLVSAEFCVFTRNVKMKNEVLIRNLHKVLGVLTNAESLTLSTDVFQAFVRGRKKGKDWEKQLSFECRFCHLKLIELKNFEGCENGLIFLGFLVKNALVLETITITVTETLRKNTEAFALFTIKLGMIPKASSSAKFILKK